MLYPLSYGGRYLFIISNGGELSRIDSITSWLACSVLTEQTEYAKLALMNEQQFTEDFGLFFEHLGVPRMAGRILAWLLICDPPEQSMHDLVAALGASKSSISTMTRMLISFRLIERVRLPGERRDFYRVRPDLWRRSLDDAQRKFEGFREMAERGLNLLEGESAQRRARVQEMHDIYDFLTREFPGLVDRWEEEGR